MVPAAPAATPGPPMAGPAATPTVARRGPRAVVTAGRRPGLVGPVAARAAAREAVQTAGQVLQGPTRRVTRLAATPPPGPATVVTARVVPQMAAMVLLLLLLPQVAVVGVALALLLLRESQVSVMPPPTAMPATAGMVVPVPLLLLLLVVVLAATRARVTAVPARPTLARVVTRPGVRALPMAARVPLERVVRVARSPVVSAAEARPTALPVVRARVVVLVAGTPARLVA